MLRSDFFSYKTAIILAVLIVGIGVWQYTIYKGIDSATYIGKTYARTDATGLNFAAGSSFTYFYYYLGLYPLAVLDANGLDYSKNGAIKALVGGGRDRTGSFRQGGNYCQQSAEFSTPQTPGRLFPLHPLRSGELF